METEEIQRLKRERDHFQATCCELSRKSELEIGFLRGLLREWVDPFGTNNGGDAPGTLLRRTREALQ